MQNRNKLRFRGFTGGSLIKNLPANAGDVGSILGQDDPLEEEMATHSSILAWRIPWTRDPGRLQSKPLDKLFPFVSVNVLICHIRMVVHTLRIILVLLIE